MIRKGDIVRIKPEWQDKGDDKITFIALEDAVTTGEGRPRVKIEAQMGLPFNPVQVVHLDMLVRP